MDIKIWDNQNKQWLDPMAIYFGKDNIISKIQACAPIPDPLSDGCYDIEGDDLKKVAIIGDINYNTDLLLK